MCLAPGSALTARENRKNHVKTCKMYTRGDGGGSGGIVLASYLSPAEQRVSLHVCVHVVRVFVPFVGYCHKVNACKSLCVASPRALTLTAELRVRARGERECRSIWGGSDYMYGEGGGLRGEGRRGWWLQQRGGWWRSTLTDVGVAETPI